jgi:hypothetical protein
VRRASIEAAADERQGAACAGSARGARARRLGVAARRRWHRRRRRCSRARRRGASRHALKVCLLLQLAQPQLGGGLIVRICVFGRAARAVHEAALIAEEDGGLGGRRRSLREAKPSERASERARVRVREAARVRMVGGTW